MPFNGSGVFNRNYSWTIDAANTIPITATRVDADTNDIASGLSNCITRDGQSPATANISMGGFRLVGGAPGVVATDFVTMGQSDGRYLALTGGALTGVVTTTSTFIAAGLITANGGISGTTGAFSGTFSVGGVLSATSGSFSGTLAATGNIASSSAVTAPSMTSTTSGITTTGTGAGFTFTDRANAGLSWTWYASGTLGILYSASVGPVITANYSTANVTVSGTWTGPNFIGTSDERLKEDVADFVPRDDLAELVRFVSYVRKSSGRHELGVIAQQLQKIAPEYVYEGEDGILGVDKAGLALEVAMGLAIRVRDLEGR